MHFLSRKSVHRPVSRRMMKQFKLLLWLQTLNSAKPVEITLQMPRPSTGCTCILSAILMLIDSWLIYRSQKSWVLRREKRIVCTKKISIKPRMHKHEA